MLNSVSAKLLLAILCILGLRLIVIATTPLIDDETYYAMYARHLSWGYIDHGPVIGYLIATLSWLAETPFNVRFMGWLVLLVMMLVIMGFASNYLNLEFSLYLALIVISSFIIHLSSLIITPDTPLLALMMITVLLYYRAYHRHRYYFYIAGIALGLALLSKISAVFPAIGIGLYPLLVKSQRHWLKSLHWYLSFVLALLVFAPFLLWNYWNEWAFVSYQGSNINQLRVFNWQGFSDFLVIWLGYLVLVGPLIFYASVIAPWQCLWRWSTSQPMQRYFSLVGLVPLVYFGLHSLFYEYEVNWIYALLFGGVGLLIWLLKEQRIKPIWWKLQLGYSLAILIAFSVQTMWPVFPLQGYNDPTNRYYYFKGLDSWLKQFLTANPAYQELRLVANNYQIPSVINVTLKPVKEAISLSVNYHDTLYSFIYDDSQLVGQSFLLVSPSLDLPKHLKASFERFRKLDEFSVLRQQQLLETYSLWLVEGYLGKSLSIKSNS